MRNIEKYKDIIKHMAQSDMTCCVNDLTHKGICLENCTECKRDALEWLLSECKEQVLDDVEKKYLSTVIKPFREKIECIFKAKLPNLDEYYIIVGLKDNDSLRFPCFKGNTMYKGMEVDKEYELEELGL
jgi:hypothetical protein